MFPDNSELPISITRLREIANFPSEVSILSILKIPTLKYCSKNTKREQFYFVNILGTQRVPSQSRQRWVHREDIEAQPEFHR